MYYPLISSMNRAVAIPSIVTSGLYSSLDAGNALSYSGSGTTWTDLSGNGNNGLLVNGVGYNSSYNGNLTFDGINDYVAMFVGDLLSNKSNFSIDMWFKITNPATTSLNSLFSFGSTNAYSNDILLYQYTNKIGMQVNNGADGSAEITYNSNLFNNVQVVYNGTLTGNSNRLKIYLNGVEQTATFGYTVPAVTTTSTVQGIVLGSYMSGGYNNWLNGNISIFRIYNTSLTSTDVTQNFNAIKSRYGY